MYEDSEQIHKLRLQGIMDIVKGKPKPCKLYNGYQADTWYRLSGQASKANKITPKLPPPESKQCFLRKVASALPADSIARVKFALDQEHPSEAHAVFKKIDKLNRKKRVIIDKQLFIDLLQLPKDLRTKEHRRYIDDFLRSLPAFQTTPEYIFPHLAKELNVVSYPKDHILFYQGDPGDKWYVILEGTISISINKPGWPGPPPIPQIPVAAMREGDKFGDLALLNDLLRSTSVTISSDHCTFITLDKPQFIRLMGPATKHETSEKMTFLRKVSLFASMDRKSLKQVADKTVVRQAKEDTILIKEGQTLATAFVIRKGICAVFKSSAIKKDGVKKQLLLGHIRKYESFNQESIWGNMGVKLVSPFTVVSIGAIEFATIIIQKEWLNAGLKLEKHPLGIMHEDEIVHRYNTTKAVEQFYVYQKKYIDKVVSEREATKPYELHSY
ncbi:cyclic nucleotide-binding-like protein [Globomyces pollinis-pini]|nr:cyclic nucleotide-binding-like protein [Globomyces pollinis-pini]